MFRIYAHHPHHALAVDDLALVANFLYRCSYLHNPAFSCQPSAFSKLYLYRYTIRPRFRSYGESSTATLSPGRMRIKFLRILPETCAKTWCLFCNSTQNIAFGSGSITTAITSIASSLLIDSSSQFSVASSQFKTTGELSGFPPALQDLLFAVLHF